MDQKEAQADGDVPKKSPFDQLDRDELIKKCKGLLAIAKNAKQAKDEYAEENAKLLDRIEKLETQKLADKESLKAMQEIVDDLTEKKLETANLEKSLTKANAQLANISEEANVLTEHAIENESLKRQIKRLTDENEELISEMEQIEAKTKEEHSKDSERYEMLKLENDKLTQMANSNEKLLNKLSEHQEQFDKISLELQETKEHSEKLIVELTTASEQNVILTQHSRKQADKLKLYKSKIMEFSAKLKQLKLSKEVLAKIVSEYSQSVTKWQLDIIDAMKQIENKSMGQLEEMLSTKTTMKSESIIAVPCPEDLEKEDENSELRKMNHELSSELETLKNQLAENDSRMDSVGDKKLIADLQQELNESKEDNERLAIEIEKIRIANQAEGVDAEEDKKVIADLQQQLSMLNEDNAHLALEIEQIRTANRTEKMDSEKDKKVIVDLQQQLNELKEENEHLALEIERIRVANQTERVDAEEDKKVIADLQQQLSVLNEDNTHLVLEIEQIRTVNRTEKMDTEKDKKVIADLQQQLNELKEENEHLALEIEKIRIANQTERVDAEEDKKFIADLQRQLSVLNEDNAQLALEIEQIRTDNQTEKMDTEKDKKVIADLQQQLNVLKEENENLALEIEKIRVANRTKRVDAEEDKKLIADLQQQLNVVNEDNEHLTLEIERIRIANQTERENYSKDFENEKSRLLNDVADLNHSLEKKQISLDELSDKNVDLTSKLGEYTVGLNEKNVEINELKSALEQLQQKRSQENEELLNEMREINEALKNRGDVISKQKLSIAELNDKIDQLQQQITQSNLVNDAANKQIEQLNDRVKEMESKAFPDDTQMSVSTISRAEEVNRMRDIEEGFEEKYNKLRVLAVKLKKKVAEQSSIIQTLDSRNNDNTNEGLQITSKLGVMEVQVKNLQLLQSENDRLLDELEMARNNGKKDQLELEKVRSALDKASNELVELKSNEIQSDAKNVNSSQAIKEYLKQIQGLKEENSENLVTKKSLENELIKLKDQLTAKDQEINSLKEVEKTLRAEQTKIKMSLKQANVLSLEMDAYEKSLNEATQKLETMNLQAAELKATISSQENTIQTLKTEIKFLEENLESERQHSIELKEQINIQQSNLKETQHNVSELKIQNDLLSKEKNATLLDLEEFRLDAARNTSEKEKIIRLLQSENEKNIRQVCELQDEIDRMKGKLAQAEQELVDVQTEYSSYKVRAQSVLRNNQTKESSREKELDEELTAIRITNDSLNQKIDALNEQNRKVSIDLEAIKQDRDHLKERCKELLQLLDESRQQIESIHEQKRLDYAEYQDNLKTQRLQIDTLNNCYKKEIAEMEEKYIKAIEELRNQKERVGDKVLQPDNRNKTKSMLSDEQQIDWILMERQSGEGSENTNTNSNYLAQRKSSTTKSRRELIPLDELLNNSFDESTFPTDRSISPTIELETTKAKLTVQESSVKHLTSLLTEAERDLAKLTQLNDVLKEELRRQERSAAREQHLHNLEYLKNVIFKFLTINCGDEKSHLVPVLNTILKLSPEETQKLEKAARGEGQRTWGSYLPGWSNQ